MASPVIIYKLLSRKELIVLRGTTITLMETTRTSNSRGPPKPHVRHHISPRDCRDSITTTILRDLHRAATVCQDFITFQLEATRSMTRPLVPHGTRTLGIVSRHRGGLNGHLDRRMYHVTCHCSCGSVCVAVVYCLCTRICGRDVLQGYKGLRRGISVE